MDLRRTCRELTSAQWLLLLGLLSLSLVISSFIIEYGFGAVPCQMCWWQRYVHWAMTVVGLGGWLLKQRIPSVFLLALMGDLALVGGFIAVWQTLGQWGVLELPASCTGGNLNLADANTLLADLNKNRMPNCAEVNFRIFGLSLAEWNALVMSGVVGAVLFYLVYSFKEKERL